MSNLPAFVRARLDEDEQVARDCIAEVGDTEAGQMYADGSGLADRDDYPSYPWGSQEREWAFMRRFSPKRVLADTVAKRLTLAEHGDQHECADLHGAEYPYVGCRTLRALALPFAAHPDYREEWRP